MFDFLYLQSYDHRPSTGNQNCCNLVSHVRLYAIGERYGIPHLKEAAKKSVDKDATKEIASEIFVQAAKLGFTTTPDSDRGLRQSIVQVMLGNATKVRNNEELNHLILSNANLVLESWRATTALPCGPICSRCATALVARTCRWCNWTDAKQNCFVSCEYDLVNHRRQECVEHRGAFSFVPDM
jgi:hypothetical protein